MCWNLVASDDVILKLSDVILRLSNVILRLSDVILRLSKDGRATQDAMISGVACRIA